MIFKIQKFCVNDGPGIRTTVFLKGCPLSCVWCHNPESHSTKTEILFYSDKCKGCMRCVKVCTMSCHSFENNMHLFDRKHCIACGICADGYCEALSLVGHKSTVQEIIDDVLKDKTFYENSGGGITLSGGEPLAQFDFAFELLRTAKENNLHTCIETSGFTTSEKIIKISKYVDLFLYDYKETNPTLHEKYTGQTNDVIIHNLFEIDNFGSKIVLRCPIIPDYNDRYEHFNGIAEIANRLKNITEIPIEPYHPLGAQKSVALDRKYEPKIANFVEEGIIESWIQEIQKKTKVMVKKS